MDITAFEMFLAIMILTKNYNGLYNKFGHIKKKTKKKKKKKKNPAGFKWDVNLRLTLCWTPLHYRDNLKK